MSDLIGPIVSGGCLYFAQPDALKGSLRGTLLVSNDDTDVLN